MCSIYVARESSNVVPLLDVPLHRAKDGRNRLCLFYLLFRLLRVTFEIVDREFLRFPNSKQ